MAAKRYPIMFEGTRSMEEIVALFAALGCVLRIENGEMIATEIPAFLRKDTPKAGDVVIQPLAAEAPAPAVPAKLRRVTG